MSLVRLLDNKCNKVLYTTPSHGQKMSLYPPLKEMYKIDISETINFCELLIYFYYQQNYK